MKWGLAARYRQSERRVTNLYQIAGHKHAHVDWSGVVTKLSATTLHFWHHIDSHIIQVVVLLNPVWRAHHCCNICAHGSSSSGSKNGKFHVFFCHHGARFFDVFCPLLGCRCRRLIGRNITDKFSSMAKKQALNLDASSQLSTQSKSISSISHFLTCLAISCFFSLCFISMAKRERCFNNFSTQRHTVPFCKFHFWSARQLEIGMRWNNRLLEWTVMTIEFPSPIDFSSLGTVCLRCAAFNNKFQNLFGDVLTFKLDMSAHPRWRREPSLSCYMLIREI